MFGPTVVGISLGAPAVMRFRRRASEAWHLVEVPLEPRSAYVMGDEARELWQHSLPPVAALRYSITFRTVLPRA